MMLADHVVERNFAAINTIRSPEDGEFLRDELGPYAGLGELIRDDWQTSFALG